MLFNLSRTHLCVPVLQGSITVGLTGDWIALIPGWFHYDMIFSVFHLFCTALNVISVHSIYLGSWRHLAPLHFSGRSKTECDNCKCFWFFLNQVDKVHHMLPFKCENAWQSRPYPPSTTVSTPTGVDHTWQLKIEASHTPIISASFSPTFLPPIISSFSTHPSLRARTNQRAEMRSYFLCVRPNFKLPFVARLLVFPW